MATVEMAGWARPRSEGSVWPSQREQDASIFPFYVRPPPLNLPGLSIKEVSCNSLFSLHLLFLFSNVCPVPPPSSSKGKPRLSWVFVTW